MVLPPPPFVEQRQSTFTGLPRVVSSLQEESMQRPCPQVLAYVFKKRLTYVNSAYKRWGIVMARIVSAPATTLAESHEMPAATVESHKQIGKDA